MSDRPLTALVLASLLVGSALTVAGSVGIAAAANTVGNAPTDVGTAAGGTDWPSVGNDERNTGHSPNVTGPRTGATEMWEFDPGAGFQTSPVVANGTVYAAEVEWYGGDGTFYALNATTGAVEWYRNGSFGNLGTAAAVTDGVVYVRNGTDVTALDAETGAELWAYTTSNFVNAPVTVADGTVYVGNSDGTVYALNATTGAEEWTYTRASNVNTAPAVANGKVYVGDTDGTVYALYAATGARAWQYSTGDTVTAPTVANGRVYVGNDDDTLYALDAETGTQAWSLSVGGLVTGQLAVADGTVYASTWSDGRLYAVDGATGTERWNRTIAGSVSAPVVDEDTVYVTGEDAYGYVYGFDAETGTQQWRYETELASVLYSSPAVVNGTLYVGIDNRGPGGLYAITEPPTARADVTPAAPTPGETVTLHASASESRLGTITRYEWDLDGDGTVEKTGQQVTARRDRAGGYAVTLEVTDDRGYNDTARLWIPVVAPDRSPLFDDWPTPGHDTARTGTATATGIVGSVRTRWRRAADASVSSPPVVADHRVFGGGAFESLGGFYALNASTGAALWNHSAGSTTSFTGATVANETVYTGDTTGQAYAFDPATGTVEWTTGLDARIEHAPVYTDDTVVVATNSQLELVPILTVYGLDPETGTERWQYAVDADTALAAANGTVYVGDQVSGEGGQYSELYALNVSTGQPAWTEEGGEVGRTYRTAGDVSAVTVRKGTVYGTNDRGHVFALSAATGAVLWNRSVGDGSATTSVRPAATDGAVFAVHSDDTVSELDPATGDIRWNTSVPGRVVTTPTAVNGTVYVGTESGTVHGIDAGTGATDWTVDTGVAVFGGVAVAGDRFYVASIAADGRPLLGAYEGTADTGPTAVADASDTSVTPGTTVSFDATPSTDDTRIVRTRWQFGDGDTARGEQVDHAYTSEGTYTATLTVTDAAGYRATETVTVSVSSPDTGSDDGGDGGFSVGAGSSGGATAPTTETIPTTETDSATTTEDAPATTTDGDAGGDDDVTTDTEADPTTAGEASVGTSTDELGAETAAETAVDTRDSDAGAGTTTSSGPGFTAALVVLAVVLLAVFAWRQT